MMARGGRTQPCSVAQGRSRQNQARRFLEVAELAAKEGDPDIEYAGVAAALAVLAGIAASDAASCTVLEERSRSQNHHDAEVLLEQITPGGEQAAKHLRQLINLKDTAHYGFLAVGAPELKRAMRQARHLVEFVDSVLQR